MGNSCCCPNILADSDKSRLSDSLYRRANGAEEAVVLDASASDGDVVGETSKPCSTSESEPPSGAHAKYEMINKALHNNIEITGRVTK